MDANDSYVLNDDHILWLINENVFQTDLPAFVFIFCCMVFGIFGNSLTVYVYHFRMKRISGHIHITWLAVFDLVSCGISIPYEMFDLRFPLIYAEPVPCKLFRTIAFFTNMCSCLLLLVIAFDRYLVTTSPLKTPSTKRATYSIILSVLIAAILSSPAPFIFGTKPVTTPYENISGIACSFDGSLSGTPYPTIYYSILGFIFFISFVILGIIYLKIALTIYHWKHSQIGETQDSISRKDSCGTESNKSLEMEETNRSNDDSGNVGNGKIIENDKIANDDSVFTVEGVKQEQVVVKEQSCISFIIRRLRGRVSSSQQKTDCKLLNYSQNGENKPNRKIQKTKYEKKYKALSDSSRSTGSVSEFRRSRNSPKRKQSLKEKANIRRSNAMFLSITIVFVVSYLPFLLLEVLKQVKVISQGTDQAWFELGTKSIYLNNVINPIIYGIINPKYRTEIKILFLGKLNYRRGSLR